MLVVAADAARSVVEARRLGVHARIDSVDWPAIRDRVFGRIDPIHDRAVAYRRSSGVDVYTEPARFVAPKVIRVGDEELTAQRFVIAVGSRPMVPDIAGLDDIDFHTSDTIMRVESIPSSMIVLGGGFIAAEMGHVFDAFGSTVHVVQRGPRLLMGEDVEISAAFTEQVSQRFVLHLSRTPISVARSAHGVALTTSAPDGSTEVVEAETLLVATGRRPNTDLLDVTAGGLEVDEHGHLVADGTYRTNVEGVWALGDAANHFQLKHMANAESRVVAHNVLHPDHPQQLPTGLAPHAVFSDPQVAAVGLTAAGAEAGGLEHVVSVRHYHDAAYGWALEDTTSFVKLVAVPGGGRLLGAHIIGPQAASLIQPLLQAMMLGQSVRQLARDVLYIHPALTEVVEQALIEAERAPRHTASGKSVTRGGT
jgi:mycothione reductase